MLEKFLHERRTGSAELESKLTEILGLKKKEMPIEIKHKEAAVDLGEIAETQYKMYAPSKSQQADKPRSIYQAFIGMYDYARAKAKDAYSSAASQVKAKTRAIAVRTQNGLRVLLRGWVRVYSVSTGGKMNSRTPYGKPHDPTKEDFFSEMMAVHYS